MSVRHPDYPVDPQFVTRWSPRSFFDTPMTEAQVMSLLEAARWAPSASNHQPARFAWGLRGDAGFAAILGGLLPGNQVWAGAAAALVVVASKPWTEKEGVQTANVWHAFDAGSAWMSLALQAQAMGLVAHAMGGFDAAILGPALGLPEGYALHAVVAVGTQGPAELLPEKTRAREFPSPRRPITERAGHGTIPA
ncbi:nitroreductase family protein [Tabrizicola oligotrophica]|uniref:Nitroreductase n=1 Tax=Tabrizicola oligotrophica TaxID=2710650 RepID=A0A6M0QP53_9RHOB|nr:nitroreductase family protein [Tabrizicola oligotrophica]NEY89046.1 nitroreductase [Tabrizicola oligotrophica]